MQHDRREGSARVSVRYADTHTAVRICELDTQIRMQDDRREGAARVSVRYTDTHTAAVRIFALSCICVYLDRYADTRYCVDTQNLVDLQVLQMCCVSSRYTLGICLVRYRAHFGNKRPRSP